MLRCSEKLNIDYDLVLFKEKMKKKLWSKFNEFGLKYRQSNPNELFNKLLLSINKFVSNKRQNINSKKLRDDLIDIANFIFFNWYSLKKFK